MKLETLAGSNAGTPAAFHEGSGRVLKSAF